MYIIYTWVLGDGNIKTTLTITEFRLFHSMSRLSSV